MSKILIVEDEADLCETYTDALELDGHDVSSAGSSADALRCLVIGRMRPDVVILDMQLSGDSGIVILGLIRRLPRLGHTKVIIASGHPDMVKYAISQWGADLFLPKPVSLTEMRQVIKGLCSGPTA